MFLLDELQWPEPLGETHNIKLHRKATIPVLTRNLPFLQQSGLSIALKFLFHAQCIWLLSPKARHECLQACPDGIPLGQHQHGHKGDRNGQREIGDARHEGDGKPAQPVRHHRQDDLMARHPR